MNLKQKLIANRMNISFLLFLLLLAGCAPLTFFNKISWVISPIVISLLLIAWLVYSSIAKGNLIKQEIIMANHGDLVEDLDKVFKPNSQFKKIFAAYGLSIAIMVIFFTLSVVISIEKFMKYATPFTFIMVFAVVYAFSYILIRNKIK